MLDRPARLAEQWRAHASVRWCARLPERNGSAPYIADPEAFVKDGLARASIPVPTSALAPKIPKNRYSDPAPNNGRPTQTKETLGFPVA